MTAAAEMNWLTLWNVDTGCLESLAYDKNSYHLREREMGISQKGDIAMTNKKLPITTLHIQRKGDTLTVTG